MPLDLTASIDRALVCTDAPSERHLMLTVSATAPQGSSAVPRQPINLALAVDASGSMHGEKLARAKEAASFVVRHLSALDRLAVVAYGDGVTVVAPSTPLTAQTKTDLLYRIRRIEADGRTNLSGGWLAACREVAQHQRPGQIDRVVLLSDGLANVGITAIDELVEHADQLRQRGIATSTMGVGADFNEELLEPLARHGGGRFQYVESAKHIPDCVEGELGEVLRLAARAVALEVDLPEPIDCPACLNDYRLEPTPRGVRVHLGDLTADDARRVVLRIAVAPGEESELSLAALALYVDGATGQGTETRFPIVRLRRAAAAEVALQPADADVEREVALLLAARAKEEAAALGRRGDTAGAASRLDEASRVLRASAAAPSLSSEIVALAELARGAATGLSAREIKELSSQSYLARETRRRYDPPRGRI